MHDFRFSEFAKPTVSQAMVRDKSRSAVEGACPITHV